MGDNGDGGGSGSTALSQFGDLRDHRPGAVFVFRGACLGGGGTQKVDVNVTAPLQVSNIASERTGKQRGALTALLFG